MMNACDSSIRDRNFFRLKSSGNTTIEFLFATPAGLRAAEDQGRCGAMAGSGEWGRWLHLLISSRDLEFKTRAVFLIPAGTS